MIISCQMYNPKKDLVKKKSILSKDEEQHWL